MMGAVATVAAADTPTASANACLAEGRPAPPDNRAARRLVENMFPITAAKLSCQPTSVYARGLNASVAVTASRTAYQRERGRSASAAISPAAPITPARWIEAPAPVIGT